MQDDSLLEVAFDGVIIVDAESLKILFANQTATGLLKYGPGELENLNIALLGVETTLPFYQKTLQTTRPTRAETVLKCADQSLLSVEISLTWVHHDHGPRLVLIFRDISARLKEHDDLSRKAFMVSTTQDYMAIIDHTYCYEALNEAALKAHQLKETDIVGQELKQIWGDETFYSVLKKNLDSCLQGEYIYFQAWLPFMGLQKRWLAVSLSPYKGRSGEIGHVVLTGRDITEKKLAEEERESYLKTLAILHEVVIELDSSFTIRRVNEAFNQVMPMIVNTPTPLGNTFLTWVDQSNREKLEQVFDRIQHGEVNKEIIRFKVNESNATWLEGTFTQLWQGGKIEGIRGILRDITQIYEHEKQIEHLAYHDGLTGLPNRFSLSKAIEKLVKSSTENGSSFGVIFIDLDGFNQINEGLGHTLGDSALRQVAQRLQQALPENNQIFRWAGDEFVILVGNTDDRNQVRQLLQLLKSSSSKPISFQEISLHVSFSGGMAFFPTDSKNAETLISQAHKAAIYSKQKLRNSIQIYSKTPSHQQSSEELSMRNVLTEDILGNRIQVAFQPKVNARTGNIIGIEALARWNSETFDQVNPSVFIPMAEQMGLIVGLGEQVMRKSFEVLKRVHDLGYHLNLSVNISRRQLFSASFVSELVNLVDQAGLAPDNITLEITESISMFETDNVLARLKTLSHTGFRISIDDFGTGYSSLSQLHQMPVDEIKIDLSFTRRLNTTDGLQLVQAIAHMAEALDLEIVAEGVENEDAASILRRLGVHELQGFLYGKPMSADDLVSFLKKHPNRTIGPGNFLSKN